METLSLRINCIYSDQWTTTNPASPCIDRLPHTKKEELHYMNAARKKDEMKRRKHNRKVTHSLEGYRLAHVIHEHSLSYQNKSHVTSRPGQGS